VFLPLALQPPILPFPGRLRVKRREERVQLGSECAVCSARASIDARNHNVPSVQPCCSAGSPHKVVCLHCTSTVPSTSTTSSGANGVGRVRCWQSAHCGVGRVAHCGVGRVPTAVLAECPLRCWQSAHWTGHTRDCSSTRRVYRPTVQQAGSRNKEAQAQ